MTETDSLTWDDDGMARVVHSIGEI
jgi:hypothetical protein